VWHHCTAPALLREIPQFVAGTRHPSARGRAGLAIDLLQLHDRDRAVVRFAEIRF
jgi:hypothetical protein